MLKKLVFTFKVYYYCHMSVLCMFNAFGALFDKYWTICCTICYDSLV